MHSGLVYPLIVAAWALVVLVNFAFCQDLECTDDRNDIQVNVASPGSISSPNYPAQYPNTLQCKWKLTAPDGSRIKLTIKGVDFGDNDFVELLDGLEDDSPEIATYTKCAGGELQLFSSGRDVLIWFVSDDSAPGKGFTLDYQAVPSDKITCIQKSPASCPIYRDADGMFGVIRNPKSPQSTSRNLFCSWTIEVPSGKRILLTFNWFGLAEKRGRRCSDDLVRTRASGGTTSDFCGCDLPPKQILDSEKAYFEMSTWRGRHPGLTASYRALGPHECNEGAATCPSNVREIGTNRDGDYCYDTVLDEVGGEIAVNITGKLHIVCDEYIQVSVRRADYPGLAPYTVHLEDPMCKPTFINSSVVTFKFGPEVCKTEQEEDDEKIHYTNVIHAVVDLPTNDSAITRKHKTVLPFKCSYEKKAVVSKVSYSPRSAVVVTRTADYGNFTYFMDMYTTKEYDEKVEEYPVEVGLGQPLFLEGRVESGDKDLLVFLEMCKATLTSNHNDKPDHMIIENSCPRDNTLEYNYTVSAVQRFSLAAFRFQNGYDDVFIHCKLTVCRKQDSESRCVKGCETEGSGARKRRSPDQDRDYSVTLYIGPVSIREGMESAPDSVHTEQAAASEGSDSLLFVIAAIVGILAVLAVGLIIALIVIFKRRRASDNCSILVVNEDEEH